MAIDIFIELSLVVIIAVIVSGIMRFLKQPAIIGYILTGIIVSPYFLNLIQSSDVFSTFSQIGIALLLFMVGLNLNPRVIKEVGRVSIITGIGQVMFTSIIGFLIGKLMGFSTIISIYVAIALTFSSTVIIMKLLSDKGDLETLYGRIAIGFLIVQDLIVILILMIVSSISSEMNLASLAFETITKGIGLLGLLFLISIYVLPKVTKSIAKSQEFLLLFSIGWCFAIASAFHYLNFSVEAGALLAGITLSFHPYHYEISAKMRPLRDFFIILFFILLGSQMVFSNLSNYVIPILIFSLFILIGNPLIVMILMGLLGYSKRNSFFAGLTVAQISEFSLILIAMGVKIGHLSTEVLSFVTAIGLITIAGSSYLIIHSNTLYLHLSRFLELFERKGKKIDEHKYHRSEEYDVILFGYSRIGYDILESLKKTKKTFLIIDYNPEIIRKLSNEGFECRYGDADNLELLNDLDFSKTKMIISTIPDFDTNLLLIHNVHESNNKGIIAVTSHEIDEAIRLYKEGATYVIMPHFLGGHHIGTMIEDEEQNFGMFLKQKIAHLEYIKKRKMIGHKHPRHHAL